MMVEIADLRDAKRLATRAWDVLLPAEKQRALYVLGRMYEYHDSLATYTAIANGRIERLCEALELALANESGWRDEARAAISSAQRTGPAP